MIYKNADCNRYFHQFRGNQFGFAPVDPPFGIGEHGGVNRSHNVKQKNGKSIFVKCGKYKKKNWDNSTPSLSYFKSLFRVSRNQAIFGANYFGIGADTHEVPKRKNIKEWLQKHPIGWIAWDKCNGNNSFRDYELIWTSFKFKSYVLKYMWSGMMQGKSITEGHIQQGNKKLNEKRIHPTQKPIIVYRYLLQQFAQEGDLILDTHVGSASSLIACEIEGFDYVAFEVDTDYYTAGNDRKRKYFSQMSLF